MELSMLCGVKVQLVMEDVTLKRFTEYKSEDSLKLVELSPQQATNISEHLTNDDVSGNP